MTDRFRFSGRGQGRSHRERSPHFTVRGQGRSYDSSRCCGSGPGRDIDVANLACCDDHRTGGSWKPSRKMTSDTASTVYCSDTLSFAALVSCVADDTVGVSVNCVPLAP